MHRFGLFVPREATLLSPSSEGTVVDALQTDVFQKLDVRPLRPIILADRRFVPRPDADRRVSAAEQAVTGRLKGEKRSGGALKNFVDEVKCFLLSNGGVAILAIAFGLFAVAIFRRGRKG